jgi:electron transport complex protein RnfD
MIAITKVPPPHIRGKRTSAEIMGNVCIALIPPAAAAVYYFGWAAFWRLLVSAAASLTAARLTAKTAAPDLAALVTGLILCLSCPAGIPLWLLAGGCFFAVCVIRDGFGGIGCNLFNPAMAARGLMIAVFPAYLGGYGLPDALSSPTPLAGGDTSPAGLLLLFTGRVGGSMGETSALMILLGAGWLLFRRIIRPAIPLLALAGFGAVILLSGESVPFHLLSGSILFGAVYIFTDYTSKPVTAAGEALFAAMTGAAAALLRLYGRYPEGVCFAVLLMNVLSPWLEHLTIRKAKEIRV